jgi:DNA-binding Xre family transcriptional regulator
MKKRSTNPRIGTNFEEFLRAEGRLDEATTLAIKRVLAWQLKSVMTKAKVSQAELARRMGTSRAVIRRLLDKDDPSVTLSTMTRAASALGKSLSLKLAA